MGDRVRQQGAIVGAGDLRLACVPACERAQREELRTVLARWTWVHKVADIGFGRVLTHSQAWRPGCLFATSARR